MKPVGQGPFFFLRRKKTEEDENRQLSPSSSSGGVVEPDGVHILITRGIDISNSGMADRSGSGFPGTTVVGKKEVK